MRARFFILILVFVLACVSCATISPPPKAPYPFSYHRDNQTCTYFLYMKYHYQEHHSVFQRR